jgi:hypothetical protein
LGIGSFRVWGIGMRRNWGFSIVFVIWSASGEEEQEQESRTGQARASTHEAMTQISNVASHRLGREN